MNKYIKKLVEKKGFLIVGHRGVFKANIIENTIDSFKATIMEGAEIVEIDLIESSDGVLYLFHDGNEERVFQKKVDLFGLTSAEIDNLTIYNHITDATDMKLVKMEDYLNFLTTQTVDYIINVDRCYKHFGKLLPLLDKYDLGEHILIKAPLVPELKILADHHVPYMFMGIVKKKEDQEALEAIEGLNLVALEVIVPNGESDYADKNCVKELKEQGYLVWFNSITLNDNSPMFFDWDDNSVIRSMDFSNWDKMMEYQPDIIQTDWCAVLNQYRSQRSK